MKYELIIFDKDGTLLEFESVWISIGEDLTQDFIAQFNIKETQSTLLKDLGIEADHILPSGILSSGTTRDIVRELSKFTDEDITSWVFQKMDELAIKYEDAFELIEGADDTIRRLHNDGYTLAIVTADDYVGTTRFLEKFDILKYFDVVITSDRSEYQKPEKEILLPLLELTNIDYSQMVMVGDTPIDMGLGKNAGLGLTIGVLSGTSKASDLEGADYILNTVNELYNNDQLLWEGEK